MASRGFAVVVGLAVGAVLGCDDGDGIGGLLGSGDGESGGSGGVVGAGGSSAAGGSGIGASGRGNGGSGIGASAGGGNGIGGGGGGLAVCDDAMELLPRVIGEDLTIGPGCVRMDEVEVDGSATLTIAPGTRVEIEAGGYLSVGTNGGSPTLSAVGTAEAPITFTSSNGNPRAGDWQCIYLAGDGSELDHVVVEFGGAACGATGGAPEGMIQVYGSPRGITNAVIQDSSTVGVQLEGTPTLFENNTFRRNVQAPIRARANSLTSIGLPNAFESGDVIIVESDLVTRSGTWQNHGVPYRFTASVGIQGQITVAAGVTVQMTDGSLDVGTFDLLGTAEQPVVFTSAQATPAPGDWGCIFSGAALRIEHAVLEYAGSGQSCTGGGSRVALVAAGGSTITDTVFRNIAGAAIETDCGEDLSGWCSNTFEGLEAEPLVCGSTPTACP